MQQDDLVRLQHMRDAAQEALAFGQGKTRAALDSNRMLALSLAKDLEIIGEAASRVTETTQAAYPQLPWRNIIAMRNRLIHGYFDIDLDRVWDTLTTDLPPLVEALENILRSAPASNVNAG